MSILTWIEDKKRQKVLNAPNVINPTEDSSKGLWTRCDKCGVILYIKHLKENQRVCFGCSYHLQMSSQERIENLIDKSSWRPLDETLSPCDPLEFYDQKNYTDRLQDAQERTGLQDAVQTGTGTLDGIPVALGVMDFSFMGGSMGSVVGEKITRLIEYATQEGLTLLIVSASGGARMQEGVFSLMQMAKISSALQVYQSCANLLYISILTSPTTGGVTASFAMLGDIIFAEPKALIAFAGRRVIEQTLREDLPDDFQTSEYMLHHGLVDLIVPRRFLRQALSESIRLYQNAPFKRPGRIPFGVQNPITFLTEEKIRRRWVSLSTCLSEDTKRPAFEETENSSFLGSLQKDLVTLSNNALQKELVEQEKLESQQNQGLQVDQRSKDNNKSHFSVSNGWQNESSPNKLNVDKQDNFSDSRDKTKFDSTNSPIDHTNIRSASSLISNQTKSPLVGGQKQNFAEQKLLHQRVNPAYAHILEEQLYSKARQSTEYRNILTSFSMVFNLFSKYQYLTNSEKFDRTLKAETDKLLELSSIDLLNQSIELAATESVEWKAFYLHQRLSKTTGFLEDFITPIVDSEKKNESNLLFYKSICRSSTVS